MAGRTLTEQENARRAARRLEKKHAVELGPLFGSQAPKIDEHELLLQRRMGHARSVEYVHERLGSATQALAVLDLAHLERLARQHLPAESFAKLNAFARRTYPSVGYWRQFWVDVLSGQKRVACKMYGFACPLNKVGWQARHEDWQPPADWVAPFDAEWRKSYFWRTCKSCGLWHAPGQVECVEGGGQTPWLETLSP